MDLRIQGVLNNQLDLLDKMDYLSSITTPMVVKSRTKLSKTAMRNVKLKKL